MFGGRGAGNFLTKLTAGAAFVFMVTSLSLSYLGISGAGSRLFDEDVIEEEAAAPAPAPFEEFGVAPGDAPADAGTGTETPAP